MATGPRSSRNPAPTGRALPSETGAATVLPLLTQLVNTPRARFFRFSTFTSARLGTASQSLNFAASGRTGKHPVSADEKRRLGNQKYHNFQPSSASHPKVSHVFGSGARLSNVGCFCLEKKEGGAFINLSTAATNWKKSSRCLTLHQTHRRASRASPQHRPRLLPNRALRLKHTQQSLHRRPTPPRSASRRLRATPLAGNLYIAA